MEIPGDILDKLKCTSCESYLSRGPVYLQHDGAAVCSRCYTPKHPATRNTQYEATAKLLEYPCKNWELGCLETVPFVQKAEVIPHEEVCEYRQYVCPVLGSARCDWLGIIADMLAHCRDQHPGSVLQNPCSLTHNIKASLQNYIISAFDLLFLLHTKVGGGTDKIFHAVRLLGASVEASNFFFNLDIKRNGKLISKKGQVAPECCLAILDDTSIPVSMSSLLLLLGGFNNTTFTVTVKQRVRDSGVQLTKVIEKCIWCKVDETAFLYRDNNDCLCKRCVPTMRVCKKLNQSCMHSDTDIKCRKHELYYCHQATKCFICFVAVLRGSLSAHCDSAHQDITHKAASTWRVTETQNNYNYCLVSSVVGTAVCQYYLDKSQFELNVYTSITSEHLREFRCSVQVTDPATGHARTFTPDAVYDEMYDWHIVINKNEYSWWNVVFDICVNITKI